MNNLEKLWYYQDNGQQSGPYTYTQFESLIKDAKINSDSHIWTEDMADWLPLGKTEYFKPKSVPPKFNNSQPNSIDSTLEYDMATMDLKGKRYRAAESKFKELTLRLNTSEVWCGLGIAKYGLILEDITIDEVFYCFDKAKVIDQSQSKDLDMLVMETSIEVVKNLYDALLMTRQNIDNAAAHRIKAGLATLAGTVMTIGNNRNRRVFGSIASAGLTAVSYKGYVNAGATINEMTLLHNNILVIIDDIRGKIQQFVVNENSLLDKFYEILDSNKPVVVEPVVVEPVVTPVVAQLPKSKADIIKELKAEIVGYQIGLIFCLLITIFGIVVYVIREDYVGGIGITVFFGLGTIYCSRMLPIKKQQLTNSETEMLETIRSADEQNVPAVKEEV